MIKPKKHDKRKERGKGFFHSLRFLVATVVKRARKKLWVFLKSNTPRGATTKHKKLDKIKEKRYSFTQSLRFLVATVVKPMQKKLWVFLKPNAPIGARSLVMFFSHKNRGQSLATIAVLVTAITLAGCGGGGGSSGGVTPPPPLVPVNAVMTVTVTPSDGATSVARDSNVVMTYNVTSGTYTSTTGTLSCAGTSFVLAQTTDTTGKKVTFSPSTALPYGSTCIAQGVATATGQNGGSQANISWKSTFSVEQLVCKTGEEVKNGACVPITCPAGQELSGNTCITSWWPPANITPMGTKVYGSEAVRLPVDCTKESQQCWKDLVKSGAIKWLATSATMTGLESPLNTRPVVIAFYLDNKIGYNGQVGLYHTHIIYADTGEKIGGTDITNGGSASDVDWVVGNNLGVLFRDKRSGACLQLKWNPPTTQSGVSSNVWDFIIVPCP